MGCECDKSVAFYLALEGGSRYGRRPPWVTADSHAAPSTAGLQMIFGQPSRSGHVLARFL